MTMNMASVRIYTFRSLCDSCFSFGPLDLFYAFGWCKRLKVFIVHSNVYMCSLPPACTVGGVAGFFLLYEGRHRSLDFAMERKQVLYIVGGRVAWFFQGQTCADLLLMT